MKYLLGLLLIILGSITVLYRVFLADTLAWNAYSNGCMQYAFAILGAIAVLRGLLLVGKKSL